MTPARHCDCHFAGEPVSSVAVSAVFGGGGVYYFDSGERMVVQTTKLTSFASEGSNWQSLSNG